MLNIDIKLREIDRTGVADPSSMEDFTIHLSSAVPAHADATAFNAALPTLSVAMSGNTSLTTSDVCALVYSTSTANKYIRLYVKLKKPNQVFSLEPQNRYGRSYNAAHATTTSYCYFNVTPDVTPIADLPTPAQGSVVYATWRTLPANLVVEGVDLLFMTSSERTKLQGVADGATAYSDVLARSACVAQTITNGVTTSSPSQNAVYDALALKASLAGATFTGDIVLQNTSPTLTIKDTDSTGASQTGIIQFTDSAGTQNAWIGYGSTGNTNVSILNTLGDIVLLPNSGNVLIGTNTAIHSGNIASQTVASAGNATTAGGLAVNSTGTNNVANQIVRTQANGYTNFGYINTNVAASASAFSHYFGETSTDGYIRPKTLANVQAEIVTAAAVAAAGDANKVPLAGGSMTGKLTITKNVGTSAGYTTGQLELATADTTDDVVLGFNRGGASGAALVHEGTGLILRDSANALTQFQAGDVVGDDFSSQSSERIVSPGGGTYSYGATITGALYIQLPVGRVSTMTTIHARVFNYSTNTSFDIFCGGYNYTSGWVNCFAYMLAKDGSGLQYNVRFGYTAGGKSIIYIGELSTAWSYPKLHLLDVQQGHSGTFSQLRTGWVLGCTSSAFETVSTTIAVCAPGSATTIPTSDVGGNIWIA
jgi:hypothetical protein